MNMKASAFLARSVYLYISNTVFRTKIHLWEQGTSRQAFGMPGAAIR